MQLIPASIAAALGIGIVAPAFQQGQALTIKDLISQTSMPNTLKVGDLSPDYKAFKFKVSGASDGLMGMGPIAMMGLMGSGSGNNGMAAFQLMGLMDASWTKADTVKLNGNEYLVTYKPEISMPTANSSSSKPGFLLRLNLIRSDMISSVEPLPDVTKEELQSAFQGLGVTDSEPATGSPATLAPNQASTSDQTAGLSNAKQIDLGMIMYINDYDDMTPYAQSTATVRALISPYVKNKNVWQTHNPNNSEFFFNMSIAGVELTEIPQPADTPMFYESKPWPDGTRVIAYVDGHAKRVNEDAWPAVEKLLHLPLKKKSKPLPAGYLSGGG